MTAPLPQHHVTITVEEASGNTLMRIKLLTDALVHVLQGERLIRVLTADYVEGCIEMVIEGRPHCENVSAKVHVEVEPMREPMVVPAF